MHVWRRGGAPHVVLFPKCFHLYDRVGKPRVGHDERFSVPRIPTIVELCMQAGVDLAKYPTKRRTKPVYCIEGRIVDFESVAEDIENKIKLSSENIKSLLNASPVLARHVENFPNLVMNNSNLDWLSEEERNKHQSRNGLHAWQKATIDDFVGLNSVWHVDDLNGSPLNNNLKRYYGKAPAVVELCVHGGAHVPNQYKSMMRLDVVSPDRNEVDLVA
ncbi:APO protein 3 [Arachis hypogaea]|nr:APO protein 3 [Arachis hypogaea]